MRKIKLFIPVAVLFFLTACVTTGYSTRSDHRLIQVGAQWATVGGAAGALFGVATNNPVEQSAATGALILGTMAVLNEMVQPPTITAAPAPVPPLVHLPGHKEIFISGWLEPEVKWEVIRELRALGYLVTEASSAPIHLRIEQREIRDPGYVVVAYLLDRASGRLLAQGRGEVRLTFITEERRMEAKKQAAIAAIRSLQ